MRLTSPLDRLLRAAAAVPPAEAGEVPFGVEAHALAAWRRPLLEEDSFGLSGLFRRGLAIACLVMLGTLLLSWPQLGSGASSLWSTSNPALILAYTQ